MINFPHQINQIHKLVSAMQVINELISSGQDISDDGVLGYALARQGVYTFRGHTAEYNIEERIRQEKLKITSNQGARTCARDLRRLFSLLRYIDNSSGEYEITELGQEVITAGDDLSNDTVKSIWRRALRGIELYSESGRVSHPYVILLRLLRQNAGLHSVKLSLSLEAEDDSEEEFQRILNLSLRDDWDNVCTEIGASDYQVRNAVKILPSLAKQVEDARVEGERYYLNDIAILLDQENNNEDVEHTQITNERQLREIRRVDATQIASFNSQQTDEYTTDNTTTDLSQAIRTRRERINKHHQLVRSFALILEDSGYTLYENPMDCLGVKEGCIVVLCEIKTLDGTYDDEVKQVRDALSQLLYYETFNINTFLDIDQVQKIAIFSSEINDGHKSFLQACGCLVVWYDSVTFTGTSEAIYFLTSNAIINL